MSKKSTLRRRSLVATAAAFATALLAAAPGMGQPAAPALVDLKLAVADEGVNPVTDSVLKLADTLGVYKAHGLNLTLVSLQGTPQAVAALNAGHVDVADIAIDATIRLRASNGLLMRGVVSSTLGPPYLIAAKSEIKTVKDLVGRSFAIADNGSLDHNLTRVVLAAMGVSPDGPQFVGIGAPGVRVQALAAGRIDATTVSYGTYLPIANRPGLSIIVSPEDFFEAAPIQSKFVAALETTIAQKREAIQRFVAALADLSRRFDKDPAAWVAAMGQVRPDLSADQMRATTPLLAGRWCVNGCLNVAHVGKTVDYVYSNADFKGVPRITAADVTDKSFVEKLGAYSGGGIDARK